MKKLILGCMLSMGYFTLSTAQETSGGGILFHENEPWKEMIALAQKENKLIFMDCYTSWCGPCKALSKNVFTQKKVGDFFNPQFINVKYDMEKGDGKMLQERYKSYIVGYPTLLLIDKNGKVLQQMAGYQEADKLIQGIQKAAKGRDLFTLAAEYQAGNRELTFMKEYIESLNAAFLRDSVNRVTHRQLAAMDPRELDKDEVWDVYGAYVKDVRSAAFDYLVNNAYRYYRKLNRDYYKISSQLQFCCEKELRSLFKLNFDEQGQPQALSVDTATARKVIAYMQQADLNRCDTYLAKLYIHRLLLKGEYQEAWESIWLCHRMKVGSFTPVAVHDYIRFLIHYPVGKEALKEYLDVLEQFRATGEKRDFSYHMYRTMAEICRQLGNSKKAKELQQAYQTIDEQRMKEMVSAQEYCIEGEAPGMDGMMIYLKEYKKAPIDSVVVADGKFRLRNKLLEVKPMLISVGRAQQHILLDENPIYITCTTVSREVNGKVIPSVRLSVKGDDDQYLLQRMNQALQKEMLVMLALSLSGEEKDEATKETLNASFIRAKEESKQLYDSIVSHNKDSYVSALVIQRYLAKERPIEELEKLYLQLSDRVKNAAPGQELQQTLASMRAIGIGQTAPDFTLQTPDGKELALSSLRGKPVLLDFWASWCAPCIREIPGVKKVYEKYRDKGFEILSVSLDTKKENWTQAIEKHRLPWLHVCSLKGWQCPVAKSYHVSGVPMMLLIDAEGKIAANRLRGEKMLDEAVGKLCQ